jgi:single-strand DNA-binding protein
MSFSKVILLGNLTRDPELRATQSGMSVCNITVAINKNQGNGESQTSFITCDSFGRTAENIAKYFSKGKPILVEGHLRQDNYEDKNGNKQSKLKVVVEKFEFIGSRNGTNNNDTTFEKSVSEQKGINYHEDEEVPF